VVPESGRYIITAEIEITVAVKVLSSDLVPGREIVGGFSLSRGRGCRVSGG